MTDGKREELKERLWALDERLGDFRKWKEVIEFSGIDIPEAFIEELDDMEKEALSIVNENGGSVEGLRDEFAPWTVKGRDIVLCRKGRIVGPDALKRLFDFLDVEWMERITDDGDIVVSVRSLSNPEGTMAFMFGDDRKLRRVVGPGVMSVVVTAIGRHIGKERGMDGMVYTLSMKDGDDDVGCLWIGERKEVEMRRVLS